jgi:hypothetical protein
MAKQRSLKEVKVEVFTNDDYDSDDDHVEIIVCLAFDSARDKSQFGNPTAEDIHHTKVYLAGVFGRIGTESAPWIALDAAKHGCRPRAFVSEGDRDARWSEGCSVQSWDLLDNSPFRRWDEDSPQLYLNVPTGTQRVWVTRINEWMGRIELNDAGHTT